MKTTKLIVAAVVSAGLAFGVGVQAGEKDAFVEMNSLPAAVQKAITEKAAGGEVLSIKKENEDGKVVYEALVNTKGKKWDFEVDQNGKVLDQKEESKDHRDKGEKHEKHED